MPCADPVERSETVLVWGGSTSVGSNAIQLARNAGYRVVATGSPRNFDYVRSLGAAETALATGAYRAAPGATVVGHGLARVPDALRQLRGGISANKLVVAV
ncbi:hypothetical protein ACQP2K_21145 [Microbispora siamensis]